MENLYPPIANVLQRSGALMNAEEAQALLVALLCFQPDSVDEQWIPQILGKAMDEALLEDCRQQLQLLKKYVTQQLETADFSFNLLLPVDEDTALSTRIQALTNWCGTFLYGIGMTEIKDLKHLPTEEQEFIQDLTKIGRIAPVDEAEADEKAEKNYTQIVEYIRIGILTLYENHQIKV